MFQINEAVSNVFRANLLNENDINAYIQLYIISKQKLVGVFLVHKYKFNFCGRIFRKYNFFSL